jgi:hypothetical protein
MNTAVLNRESRAITGSKEIITDDKSQINKVKNVTPK